jgi:hypothetical protein
MKIIIIKKNEEKTTLDWFIIIKCWIEKKGYIYTIYLFAYLYSSNIIFFILFKIEKFNVNLERKDFSKTMMMMKRIN